MVLTKETVSTNIKNELLDIETRYLTLNKINDLFSSSYDIKSKKVTLSKLKATDVIYVPYSKSLNITKPGIMTTAGRYLFNKICIEKYFDKRVPYFNKPVKPNGELINIISNALVNDIVTPREVIGFLEALTWLGYRSKLFLPVIDKNMISPNPIVTAERNRLLKLHKSIVDNNDIVGFNEKIEKPILLFAEEVLKDNPSFFVFAKSGGKPTLNNQYRDMCIFLGAVYDPQKEKNVIITQSLFEGIDKSKYSTIVNQGVGASHGRSQKTAEGGTIAKRSASALQSIKINKDANSDCGTKIHKKIILNEKNYQKYNLFWFKFKGERNYTILNYDNFNKYKNKEVLLRTPLFCKDEIYCCKCTGMLPQIKKMFNIGPAVSDLGNVIMNSDMKAFHSSGIASFIIDIYRYMNIEKKDSIFIETKDGTILINVHTLEILIEDKYLQRDKFSIQYEDSYDIFGLFKIRYKIKENSEYKEIIMKYPSKLTFRPDNVYLEKSELAIGGRYNVLSFDEGSVFLKSNSILQDLNNVKVFLDVFLFSSFLPTHIIKYQEIIDLWNECTNINGVSFDMTNLIPEILFSSICKSKDDDDVAFRRVFTDLNKEGNDYSITKIVEMGWGSTLVALSTAYSGSGGMRAIERSLDSNKKGKDGSLDPYII